MQNIPIGSITFSQNAIDSIDERSPKTAYEEKPIASLHSSKNSLPETNASLFPGCSQWEIDELRLILISDRRSKDDIQFLSRKLKEIPLIKTLIKRLKLDDDPEAYRHFFQLLKFEEYQEGQRIYEQKELSNYKAYLLFQGEAYKIEQLSTDEHKEFSHLKTQVSNLGSRIDLDEPSPGNGRAFKPRKGVDLTRNKLDLTEIPEEKAATKVFTPTMRRDQRFSSLMMQHTYDKEHQVFIKALETLIKKGLPTSKTNLGNKGESIKTLSPGGHFGQKALWSLQKRDHTVITKTKCEVIVFTAEALKTIKKIVETNKKRLVQFVTGCFPSLDFDHNYSLLNYILDNFTCKIFSHNQNVEIEGQNSGHFYIVYQGECEVLKKVTMEKNTSMTNPLNDVKNFFALTPSNSETMGIVTLNEGSFFGDEILFSDHTNYIYTIRVLSSEAKVLAFDKTKFLAKIPKEVLTQLKERHEQKHEKNCEILVQNLFLRGYSLDRKAFLEDHKVILEPLRESKFRTFYHQIKDRRDSQTALKNQRQIPLEDVREKVNGQYAHKLRVNTSGSKTPRVILEPLGNGNSPRVGSSAFTSMTPKAGLSSQEGLSPRVGTVQTPRYYLGTPQNRSQWPTFDRSYKASNTQEDTSKTMEAASLPNQLQIHSERAGKLDPILERRDSRRSSQRDLQSEPDEMDLVKLKFLLGDEPKKGIKNLLKIQYSKNHQKSDGIFNSTTSKLKNNYAEIAKTHYKLKFTDKSRESSPLKQEYKVYTEEGVSGPQLAKPQLYIDLPEPMLDPRKMNAKPQSVNIHMKHEKKKLNPLQRSKNRTDILFKSPRSKE